MPKNTEDPIARTVVENQLMDHLAGIGDTAGKVEVSSSTARELLGDFESVHFETATSKVRGQEVPLRRAVIVGKWEVDPNGSVPK